MLLLTKRLWMNGGAPTRCHRCQESFDGHAVHGSDGHYYCSQECRDWAEEGDIEQRARKLQ